MYRCTGSCSCRPVHTRCGLHSSRQLKTWTCAAKLAAKSCRTTQEPAASCSHVSGDISICRGETNIHDTARTWAREEASACRPEPLCAEQTRRNCLLGCHPWLLDSESEGCCCGYGGGRRECRSEETKRMRDDAYYVATPCTISCNFLRLFPCQEGSVMPGYRLVRLRAAAGSSVFCSLQSLQAVRYVDATEY